MFENLLLIGIVYFTAGYLTHCFLKLSKKFDAFIAERRYNSPLRRRIREIKAKNKEYFLTKFKLKLGGEYFDINGMPATRRQIDRMAMRAYKQYKDLNLLDRLNSPQIEGININ